MKIESHSSVIILKRVIHIKLHIKSVHEGKKPFKCILFDKTFSNKGTLNIIILLHSSVHEGIKPFKCDICETKFVTKAYVKRHMALIHEKM